ncbi:LacI family DNA-binding transcriptional regulator [Secundilactobacillus folii]|uniref:Substrate-binding domain-containing protein n=1 Tax=Secundilactobacillus folii TaxID=2678357 RepID=A0A7X2XYL2_9LACO|nr:LacI family DNA-binding transcriptional regulator [Secundilactobacillus folii]MTV83293.1 substrate-binding domain-containing protein [Secundilactobacillus folii]
MENVTIMTIARMAHVSHTTVSRALNDSPLVKEDTKKLIRDIAKQIGYTPNLNAKGLAQSKTYLIGVFFSEMKTGTSPSFLVDVLNKAREALPTGYVISIDSVDNYMERDIPQSRYDGIIVVSQSKDDDEFIDHLVEQNIPLVVLNRALERRDVINYATNDFMGAELLTEYAIRMGHREIGIIEGQRRFVSTVDRRRGFDEILRKNHLETRPEWVKHGNYLPESGYKAMRELLSQDELPTCVFVTNDDMAIGAIRACNDLGYRVPQDISILGFDDMGYTKYLVPRLTTIKKPTTRLVQVGVEALTQLLAEEKVPAKQEVFPPTLVVRDSVTDLRTTNN